MHMIWLPAINTKIDIDTYASIIAYANLLNQRQKPAKASIPSHAPDQSIPRALRMPEQENNAFNLQPDDEVIILGISNPDIINRIIPENQILEIIDTHSNYESYWHNHIGAKAVIEPLNAVATSIFEWWGECWDYTKMPARIAKLLLEAILYKTRQLDPVITTPRDQKAATQLAQLSNTLTV